MELIPTKAYYITTDESICEISPADSKEFQLKEVQELVEGFIEIVYLTDKQIMIVNEDGKFGKPMNVIATGIADLHGALSKGDYISGNAVICPSTMLT